MANQDQLGDRHKRPMYQFPPVPTPFFMTKTREMKERYRRYPQDPRGGASQEGWWVVFSDNIKCSQTDLN